jgi:hypothetical protein
VARDEDPEAVVRRLAVPGTVLLFVLAGLAGQRLVGVRREADIPMSAARVPLGGFEPLAVSFLWMRAVEHRERGDFPGAVAAYRLVTELSPRVGPAWALPAHLLVFTQSENPDPQVQWRWIRAGLSLLERGLALNPDEPELLMTLGLAWYGPIADHEGVRELAIRETGRLPEEFAVESFRRLIEIEPDEAIEALLKDSERRLEEARARGR